MRWRRCSAWAHSNGARRTAEMLPPSAWLPEGKSCAVCFSIDDVHPARAEDGFDAGGDLGGGALGHLLWLRARHPQLRTTLTVTPDWLPRSPLATRRLAALIPGLAERTYLSQRWPEGRMRLDRHPEFVAFLKSIPGVEIVPHGLHHMQRGLRGPLEFENADYGTCRAALARGAEIMAAAGIETAPGHAPPGWAAPEPFRRAVRDAGLIFFASARDVVTPVWREALTAMSGMQGQPLIYPGISPEGLIHIPANFQATSDSDRAVAILELGGLLSVKAHIVKSIGAYVALDALDRLYANYLDSLFAQIETRFGDRVWWASMGEIATRMRAATALEPA